MAGHQSHREPASVIGREAELALLQDVVAAGARGGALVLLGAAGIGKTTLWEAAVAAARARGVTVLAARSSGSDARLPFAGLIDLCESIGPDELSELAEPQRTALEAALLRAEPRGSMQSTAIALGFLAVVRSLAARTPVAIAIDDLQWLDQPSADVVAYVLRRLGEADVRYLFARRPGQIEAVERGLGSQRLERVELGGLSLGAVRRLLFERLDLTVSRLLLRRIVEVTQGNPLFALELGRSLARDGTPTVADELPLPATVEELFGARTAGLAAPVRKVLLAVALSADPRVEQVAAVTEPGALEAAVDAGVVAVEANRARASHPLLAAAMQSNSRASERRELHLALAASATEEHLRVLHLALAAVGADAGLAARIGAAADDAFARGARWQAMLLAGHALRLTPAGAPERAQRVLALAGRLDDIGDLRSMTDLLEAEFDSLPAGPLRARAMLMLSDGENVSGMQQQDAYLERALAECGEDTNLRAYLLAKRACNAAAAAVAGLREAEATAIAAVQAASEPKVERFALYALAWARALGGRPVDDLCERSRVAADPASYISASPERIAGKRLIWRGELDRARTLLSSLSELADERGDLTSYAMVRMHLCELELRAGDHAAAATLLDEWAESSDFDAQFRPQYQRCRALLAAARGDAAQAQRWADEAIDRARATACRWDELEALRARGVAALVRRDPQRAAEDLSLVWEHCEREGVRDPGAFPVAPELVEALAELGALEPAREIAQQVAALADEQESAWAGACARHCDALVALARDPRDQGASASLAANAEKFEQLGLPWDAARSRLALGRALRRARRWRGARDARGGAQRLHGPRGARLGGVGAGRARSRRGAPPRRKSRADADRATGGRARCRGSCEQADRHDAVRDRRHGGGSPLARVREARHPLAIPDRQGARRRVGAWDERDAIASR